MESIPWGKAFEVFFVGFGGVFACLIILQLSINLFSKITHQIEKIVKQSKGKE
ncbi:MAG TPA: OadG family transporter subunit [Desulfobacterales bacterium]|nr:OadG family transporter subunit [Desulfobacterales bacterium]